MGGPKFQFRGLRGRENGFGRLWATSRNHYFSDGKITDLAILEGARVVRRRPFGGPGAQARSWKKTVERPKVTGTVLGRHGGPQRHPLMAQVLARRPPRRPGSPKRNHQSYDIKNNELTILGDFFDAKNKLFEPKSSTRLFVDRKEIVF